MQTASPQSAKAPEGINWYADHCNPADSFAFLSAQAQPHRVERKEYVRGYASLPPPPEQGSDTPEIHAPGRRTLRFPK